MSKSTHQVLFLTNFANLTFAIAKTKFICYYDCEGIVMSRYFESVASATKKFRGQPFEPSRFFNSQNNIFFQHDPSNAVVAMDALYEFYDIYKNINSGNPQLQQKALKLLGAKGDVNDEVIAKAKIVAKEYLEYALYCAYAYEVKTNRNVYDYKPPFQDELSRFAFSHREQNLDNYRMLHNHYIKKEHRYSIFINENQTMEDIVDGFFGSAVRSNQNFLIDDKTTRELIFNVKKYPVFFNASNHSSTNYQYYNRYLIGNYKGQWVLFTEIIRKLKSPTKSGKWAMSYSINLAIDGDPSKSRLLYRMDYDITANHVNKLTSGKDINLYREGMIDTEIFRLQNIKAGHLHIPSEKYCIMFPNYTHSADAEAFSDHFASFGDFVNLNKEVTQVCTNKCILKGNQEDYSSKKCNLSKKTICKFLRDQLQKSEEEAKSE